MRQIKFRAWDGKQMHYFDLSDTIAPSLELNVMQFTGLPDKNGREIYEGDVLKSLGTDICVVRWLNQLACFMLENTKPTDDFDNILLPLHKGYEHREIIGNIYENEL